MLKYIVNILPKYWKVFGSYIYVAYNIEIRKKKILLTYT